MTSGFHAHEPGDTQRGDSELFPGVNAAGALRAGFQRRHRASADEVRGSSAASRTPTAGTESYELQGEIARGGMGVIVKARDRELGRDVALKVLRDELSHDTKLVRRFLEEARVTACLDHPGIVPVHEVGRDAQGRAYFAMRLVRGRELREIIELAYDGAEGWNQTRALSVIQKVCEAMAYAHEKGVIHRDLKPSNVMVGEFGEVYVMDWGLARWIGAEDTHDLRLRAMPSTPTAAAAARALSTSARDEVESPIVTMDGEVLGTPCYMPPEQAQGRIGELGPRSDVYAVGAMLYHLLAGEMPYVRVGSRVGSRQVLLHLVQGPPRPLHELRSDIPSELIAISEKAMSREPGDRYPNMLAMADDLRAFLERRVVRAYETGAWAEARKWVKRNRALSAAMSLAVAALGVGLLVSLSLKAQADSNFVRAERSAQTAVDERDRALKIARFLEDTLAGVRTSVALGRDTTMLREMMDAAASRIEKGELSAAPEAETRLMLVIGSTLRDIAQYDKSESILRRAVEKAERLDPTDEGLVGSTKSNLGMLLCERGDLDGAEEMHRAALAVHLRIRAADHVDIVADLQNLATVLEARGDLARAEAHLREALAMNRRLFTGDHRDLAINLSNLAVVLHARGAFREAEQYLREAIGMQERMFHGDHPELAKCYDNLAALLWATNELVGAEEFHRRALGMRRRILPHDHADLAASLNNLGTVLQTRGDFASAEELYREALEIQRRLLPAGHVRIGASIGNLASLLHQRGDLDAAEPLYLEGLEIERRAYGGDHSDIARSLSNLATLARQRGDLATAESRLREALAMDRRVFKGDHPDVARLADNLAVVLELRGDMAEAAVLYREALEMRKRIDPGARVAIALSSYKLARVLMRDDLAGAEALFNDALSTFRANLPESDSRIATAEVELGQVLLRQSRFAEAEESLLAAAASLERNPDPNPAWYKACVERIIENNAAWEKAEPGGGHAERSEEWVRKLTALEKK